MPVHLINCSANILQFLDGHELEFFRPNKEFSSFCSNVSINVFDAHQLEETLSIVEPKECDEFIQEVHCTRHFKWSYHYEEDYEST
uniref:Uncharacterized protein n=1 Tax=Panagrolaimus sp. JU765 TaxID=591449 RepID=A0AC34RQ44_9BILA